MKDETVIQDTLTYDLNGYRDEVIEETKQLIQQLIFQTNIEATRDAPSFVSIDNEFEDKGLTARVGIIGELPAPKDESDPANVGILEEQSIQDDSGNYVVTSVSVLKTFAKIEQLRQSRRLEDAQLKFPSTYDVTILNREGFFPNTNMIVKWRGDTYNITSTPEIDDVRVQKFYSFIISK